MQIVPSPLAISLSNHLDQNPVTLESLSTYKLQIFGFLTVRNSLIEKKMREIFTYHLENLYAKVDLRLPSRSLYASRSFDEYPPLSVQVMLDFKDALMLHQDPLPLMRHAEFHAQEKTFFNQVESKIQNVVSRIFSWFSEETSDVSFYQLPKEAWYEMQIELNRRQALPNQSFCQVISDWAKEVGLQNNWLQYNMLYCLNQGIKTTPPSVSRLQLFQFSRPKDMKLEKDKTFQAYLARKSCEEVTNYLSRLFPLKDGVDPLVTKFFYEALFSYKYQPYILYYLNLVTDQKSSCDTIDPWLKELNNFFLTDAGMLQNDAKKPFALLIGVLFFKHFKSQDLEFLDVILSYMTGLPNPHAFKRPPPRSCQLPKVYANSQEKKFLLLLQSLCQAGFLQYEKTYTLSEQIDLLNRIERTTGYEIPTRAKWHILSKLFFNEEFKKRLDEFDALKGRMRGITLREDSDIDRSFFLEITNWIASITVQLLKISDLTTEEGFIHPLMGAVLNGLTFSLYQKQLPRPIGQMIAPNCLQTKLFATTFQNTLFELCPGLKAICMQFKDNRFTFYSLHSLERPETRMVECYLPMPTNRIEATPKQIADLLDEANKSTEGNVAEPLKNFCQELKRKLRTVVVGQAPSLDLNVCYHDHAFTQLIACFNDKNNISGPITDWIENVDCACHYEKKRCISPTDDEGGKAKFKFYTVTMAFADQPDVKITIRYLALPTKTLLAWQLALLRFEKNRYGPPLIDRAVCDVSERLKALQLH